MKALLFNIQKFSLHDGKGIRTTLFFKGCNLRCKWCANPESQSMAQETMQDETVGKYYTLEEIMEIVLKDKPFYDKSGGGVTLSGGEPLMQPEFILALCDALHAAGVNVGIETAANVSHEVFAVVLEKCDFALIDLKHWNNERHKLGTSCENGRILKNIQYALTTDKPVTVRIPVIPGFNDTPDDARAFADVLKKLGTKEVHVLPFHQLGENKYAKLNADYAYRGVPQLHEADVEEFAKILTASGLQVQIGG